MKIINQISCFNSENVNLFHKRINHSGAFLMPVTITCFTVLSSDFQSFPRLSVTFHVQHSTSGRYPKGQSRRCNFAPWDRGQCPHGALFHAVPGCCECFQQCRVAGTARLGHLGAIRHCWKHLQQPGTAWNNAPCGHCPLSQGAKLHRLDRPLTHSVLEAYGRAIESVTSVGVLPRLRLCPPYKQEVRITTNIAKRRLE